MTNIQQLGDLHMAIHINKQLYEQGTITADMHRDAGRVLTERLHNLEKNMANTLHETA